MATIRAKFRCNSITDHATMTGKTVKLGPVYDSSIPEDRRFATATPTGDLSMFVDNPAAEFTLGAYYYVDFTPIEAVPTE